MMIVLFLIVSHGMYSSRARRHECMIECLLPRFGEFEPEEEIRQHGFCVERCITIFRHSLPCQGLESALSNCLNNFEHNDEAFYLLMICICFVDSWKSRCCIFHCMLVVVWVASVRDALFCLWFVDSWKSRCLHRPHASENLNLRKKSDIIWFLSRALRHNLPSQPSVVTFHRNGRCTLTLSKFRPSGLSYPTA